MSLQRACLSCLCLLLSSLLAFGQPTPDTPRQNPAPPIRPDSLIRKPDTIPLRENDSVQVTSSSARNTTTVLLLKEPPGKDNMKYIFPVLTLLLGILVNRAIDYFSERKKVSRTGRRWQAELTLLTTPIQQQLTALDVFRKALEKDVYEIPSLQIYTALKGEAFSSLDKSDLLRYIQRKHGDNYTQAVKNANAVIGIINILASHYDSLTQKFNEFLAQTSIHNKTVTEQLQQLLRAFSRYGTEIEKQYKGNPIQDQGYHSLHQLFAAHIYPKQETGNYDVYELKDQFFIPLIEALGHLRHDDRTTAMRDAATACLNAILLIKGEKGYMITNAGIIRQRYEKALQDLPQVIGNMS